MSATAVAGMTQSEQNALPSFKEQVTLAIEHTALSQPFFTTDDVWESFALLKNLSKGDRSVMGPLMKRAAKNGWIIRLDGQFVRSKIPTRHGNILPVWKSQVCTSMIKELPSA
jgi:hypothetical protein